MDFQNNHTSQHKEQPMENLSQQLENFDSQFAQINNIGQQAIQFMQTQNIKVDQQQFFSQQPKIENSNRNNQHNKEGKVAASAGNSKFQSKNYNFQNIMRDEKHNCLKNLEQDIIQSNESNLLENDQQSGNFLENFQIFKDTNKFKKLKEQSQNFQLTESQQIEKGKENVNFNQKNKDSSSQKEKFELKKFQQNQEQQFQNSDIKNQEIAKKQNFEQMQIIYQQQQSGGKLANEDKFQNYQLQQQYLFKQQQQLPSVSLEYNEECDTEENIQKYLTEQMAYEQKLKQQQQQNLQSTSGQISPEALEISQIQGQNNNYIKVNDTYEQSQFFGQQTCNNYLQNMGPNNYMAQQMQENPNQNYQQNYYQSNPYQQNQYYPQNQNYEINQNTNNSIQFSDQQNKFYLQNQEQMQQMQQQSQQSQQQEIHEDNFNQQTQQSNDQIQSDSEEIEYDSNSFRYKDIEKNPISSAYDQGGYNSKNQEDKLNNQHKKSEKKNKKQFATKNYLEQEKINKKKQKNNEEKLVQQKLNDNKNLYNKENKISQQKIDQQQQGLTQKTFEGTEQTITLESTLSPYKPIESALSKNLKSKQELENEMEEFYRSRQRILEERINFLELENDKLQIKFQKEQEEKINLKEKLKQVEDSFQEKLENKLVKKEKMIKKEIEQKYLQNGHINYDKNQNDTQDIYSSQKNSQQFMNSVEEDLNKDFYCKQLDLLKNEKKILLDELQNLKNQHKNVEEENNQLSINYSNLLHMHNKLLEMDIQKNVKNLESSFQANQRNQSQNNVNSSKSKQHNYSNNNQSFKITGFENSSQNNNHNSSNMNNLIHESITTTVLTEKNNQTQQQVNEKNNNSNVNSNNINQAQLIELVKDYKAQLEEYKQKDNKKSQEINIELQYLQQELKLQKNENQQLLEELKHFKSFDISKLEQENLNTFTNGNTNTNNNQINNFSSQEDSMENYSQQNYTLIQNQKTSQNDDFYNANDRTNHTNFLTQQDVSTQHTKSNDRQATYKSTNNYQTKSKTRDNIQNQKTTKLKKQDNALSQKNETKTNILTQSSNNRNNELISYKRASSMRTSSNITQNQKKIVNKEKKETSTQRQNYTPSITNKQKKVYQNQTYTKNANTRSIQNLQQKENSTHKQNNQENNDNIILKQNLNNNSSFNNKQDTNINRPPKNIFKLPLQNLNQSQLQNNKNKVKSNTCINSSNNKTVLSSSTRYRLNTEKVQYFEKEVQKMKSLVDQKIVKKISKKDQKRTMSLNQPR
ncbi:hypothetical protein PPERSA_07090 [Pseudocohnilembus persalinus]|uniref:Uncharacterized protein n=1 Tax=Pseudocohnilembus persalinus TaxID=266149 RepID=A0A0V0QX91_PSEPJ|nr:hypothetical protein PPERSA_07090 [Pseudocohnilembus persalinus]|eukprot:KRX06927.1 hypothetical protein PPERSA_07090 [Pseudocohnilembus persalinus]